MDTVNLTGKSQQWVWSGCGLNVYIYVIFSLINGCGYRSDVRAGLQSSLKMFIAHTSQLFLHQQSGNGHQLEIQVDSGRRILKLYQEIVQQWTLDGESWLYLLSVLLHLTISLLYNESVTPPANRDTSLGGSLADQLLQVSKYLSLSCV